MQLDQLLKTHKVKLTTRPGATLDWSLQKPWQKESNSYSCQLAYQGRRMTIDFWMGKGLKRTPTIADVLESLLSDASGFDNARNYLSWCDEFELKPNSPMSQDTYSAIKEHTENLKSLLGSEYETFLSAEF